MKTPRILMGFNAVLFIQLLDLARILQLASQPRDLIGLDRIFEGFLPLFAGIGQAPCLAQHIAEVFVDGRIPSGINRGFFQILARLLDVAQLEMSPAEAVEEAPLCRSIATACSISFRASS